MIVSARDKMGSVSPSHQGPLSQHKAYVEDALEPFYHIAGSQLLFKQQFCLSNCYIRVVQESCYIGI